MEEPDENDIAKKLKEQGVDPNEEVALVPDTLTEINPFAQSAVRMIVAQASAQEARVAKKDAKAQENLPSYLDIAKIKAQSDPKLNSSKKRSKIDDELEQLLTQQKARIKIIGCGGAGNNTLNRINELKIDGAVTIAINTDAQDLLYTNADEKILIGKELTKGLGAGSVPKVGEEAALENEREIRQVLDNSDLVFITCGLGGGTGTGSAPIVASSAKKSGALVVGITTLPFSMEGKKRTENAIAGLDKLQSVVDTLILIPNDRLLDLAPDLPMNIAFKVSDEILANAVRGIAELIIKTGLVNLDFADVRAVMKNGGLALIGIGESNTDNRAEEAIERAIKNPLLDVDISGAQGALINIIGGPDMTLDETRTIVARVSEKVSSDAKVIWGAQIDESLGKTIKVLLIVTGVKSTDINSIMTDLSDKRKNTLEAELGVEFVN